MANEFIIKNGFVSKGNSIVEGNLSGQTFNIINTPVNNNLATEILVRNSTTGDVEYRDSSTLSGGGGGQTITGYTYDESNNTFSIGISGTTSFDSTISVVSGLTVTNNLIVGGNTGMGTDTPMEKLDVRGDILISNPLTSHTTLTISATSTNDSVIDFDNNGVSTPYARIEGNTFGGGTSGNLQFYTYPSGGALSPVMVLTNQQRVGIGDITNNDVSEKLHVSGGDILVETSNGKFYSDLDNSIGPAVRLSGNSADLITIGVADVGIQGMSIGTRGDTEPLYPGYGKQGDGFLYSSAEQNGLNIISQDGTNKEDYIRFYTGKDANGGTSDIHIQGTGSTQGYVGINTENPTERLHVDGTVRIVDGTEQLGYVLTCDADGVSSWQPSSGGTSGGTVYWATENGGLKSINQNAGSINGTSTGSVLVGGSANSNNIYDSTSATIINGSSNILSGASGSSIISTNSSNIISRPSSNVDTSVLLAGSGNDIIDTTNDSDRTVIIGGVNNTLSDTRDSVIIGSSLSNVTGVSTNLGMYSTVTSSGSSSIQSAIFGGAGHLINGVQNSLILGGENNILDGVLLKNSVVIGGNSITGTSSNTVYLPNLNVVLDSQLDGDLIVEGLTTLRGQTTIGNSFGDSVDIVARVNADIVPVFDDNVSLGDDQRFWKNLYVHNITGGTLNLFSGLTTNNSGTEILVRNSSTGQIEKRDVSSITGGTSIGYWEEGGDGNTALKDNKGNHTISGTSDNGIIAGGFENSMTNGQNSSIVGGFEVEISGTTNTGTNSSEFSSIVGSRRGSIMNSPYSIIGGGFSPSMSDTAGSSMLGGESNVIKNTFSDPLILNNNNSVIGGQNNTVNGGINESIIGGRVNTINYSTVYSGLSGNNFMGGGLENTIEGHANSVILGGSYNDIEFDIISNNAIIAGYENKISGGGFDTIINGSGNTITGAPLLTADYGNTIIGGELNTIVTGYSSTIIGGNNNILYTLSPSDEISNSVILGGENISGTSNNTVYTPKLNITDVGSGTPLINLGLDANGFVVTGTTGSGTTIGYWEEGGEGNSLYDTKGGHILTGSSRYSMIAGGENNKITSHDYSGIFVGKDNVLTGSSIQSEVQNAIIGGTNNTISSLLGYMNNNTLIGGNTNFMSGRVNNSSIVGGSDHIINNSINDSVIIGGTNSRVVGSRSVVLGGNNMTGGTGSDTVFVPKLNIRDVSNGTPTMNLGVDSNGLVVSAATGSDSGNCISELWVTNLESCSPLNINTQNQGNVYVGQDGGLPKVTIDIITPNESSITFDEESFMKYKKSQKELIIGEPESGGKVKIEVEGSETLEVSKTETSLLVGDFKAESGNVIIKSGNSKTLIIEDIPDVSGANLGTDVDGKLIDLPSDSRTKHKMEELDDVVDSLVFLNALNPQQFEYKPQTRISSVNKKHYGFKVDDFRDNFYDGSQLTSKEETVNRIAKTFVRTCKTKFDVDSSGNKETVDSMNYVDLIPFMVAGIKQLNTNINNITDGDIIGGGGKKFVQTITLSNGKTTINHNLNDEDVIVQVVEVSTGQIIIPDHISNYTSNSVDIYVEEGGEYKIIIIG